MTAVESFGQPQDRGKRANRPPALAGQVGVCVVPALWRGATMIAGDQGDGVDLLGLESAKVAVLDEVVRVLVMALVADMHADVVGQGGVREPLLFAIGEGMNASRLIEEGDGQARHLARVIRPVVAPFGQLDDAATANVGIPIDLGDLFPVPGDVVEHQAFAQGQIAQRDLPSTKTPDNRIKEHDTGHREVGAAGLEARQAEPLVEGQRQQLLPDATEVPGGHATVAKRRVRLTTLLHGQRAEAEDGAGSADNAIEAGAGNLVKILPGFAVNMSHHLPFVTGRQRIALNEPLGQPDNPKLEASSAFNAGAGATGDLDAAAADIDDDRDIPRPDAVHCGEVDEPGLLGPRDDSRANPSLLGGSLQKLATVLGFANRARGDSDSLVHLV